MAETEQVGICPTCKAPASKCYHKIPRRDHIPRCAKGCGKAQYSDGLCWKHFQESLKVQDLHW